MVKLKVFVKTDPCIPTLVEMQIMLPECTRFIDSHRFYANNRRPTVSNKFLFFSKHLLLMEPSVWGDLRLINDYFWWSKSRMNSTQENKQSKKDFLRTKIQENFFVWFFKSIRFLDYTYCYKSAFISNSAIRFCRKVSVWHLFTCF